MRRPSSYVTFAFWFAIIGPFVVLPVPMLLFGAHALGVIPGAFAGIAVAHRFRSSPTPARAGRRMWVGVQIGSTISCFCFVVGAIAYWCLGLGGSNFRIWLESAFLAGAGFSLIGGAAGAFAFAVMPPAVRQYGSTEIESTKLEGDTNRAAG